jgi:DNA-binding LytR/AlgR family response regulator
MTERKLYRCVALDDQLYAAEIVVSYIHKVEDLILIKASTDVFEVIKMVDDGLVDLVFLDVQMPDLDGIKFMKLCSHKCKIILTTAYPQYALQGFDLEVVDYLLKPFSFERFEKAVNKFLLLERAYADTALSAHRDYIILKGDAKNKYHKVQFNEILFIKGLNNYICVHTLEKRIITYMNLKDIIHALPKAIFCRVHRSYIVSIQHIKLFEGSSLQINNHIIPVSQSYRADLLSSLSAIMHK